MSTALKNVKKFFPKVERVTDATRSAIIEVTQKDVNPKAAKNHNECAIAVACKRKYNLDGVIISRSVAYMVKGKSARRFKLSMSAQKEIVSFDRGASFSPGEYILASIPDSTRMGPRKQPQPLNKKKSDKPKRFRHLMTDVRHVLGGENPDKRK